MESKKGIKIAQLEEMNAQAGFRIGAHKMALVILIESFRLGYLF